MLGCLENGGAECPPIAEEISLYPWAAEIPRFAAAKIWFWKVKIHAISRAVGNESVDCSGDADYRARIAGAPCC
jgi:hypothetical protein